MTTPDDLLRAIIANPANDDLRLVFADLLDDRGEGERASFIRVQCEIARLQAEEVARFNEETDWSQCTGIAASWCPNCGDCVCPFPEDERCSPNCPLHNRHSSHCCLEDIADKRERLREREVELFNWDWLPDFGQLREWYFERFPADYQPDRPFSYCVSRGFVAEVKCACQEWLDCGPALVRRQPIERVVITDMPIYPSGGNSTFYVGGLGRFPQEYWRRLEGLPTKAAALDALSEAALLLARQTEPATSSA